MLFELVTPGLFFCLSFAIATVPAAVSAWYGIVPAVQVGIFIAASFIAFFILYLCVGTKNQKDVHYKSAVDALPGKRGFVTIAFSHAHVGQVQVDGQIWSAQTVGQETLANGTAIVVIRVEGVRLIVKADSESLKG
jgi:membrane protein implicated in regulation of membrane protease activity